MPRKHRKPRKQPNQFRVDEAWLAFRANTAQLKTPEGEFDVFVLVDAASMYILGQALAPAGAEAPSEQDALALLQHGWQAKQQWPNRLILVGKPSAHNGFLRAAERNGVTVIGATPGEVATYTSDIRASFARFFKGLGNA